MSGQISEGMSGQMSIHGSRARRIISIVIDSSNIDMTPSAATSSATTSSAVTTTVDTPPALTDLLAVFKALGDPNRLAIIECLANGKHCVCELQGMLELPANLLSHHLRVLREAGLVRDQRRGRWIDYVLEPTTLHTLQTALAHYQTPERLPTSCPTNVTDVST
jgi:ArsR family transcriptional regulator